MSRNGWMAVILVALGTVATTGCGSDSTTSSAAKVYTQDLLDSDVVWAVNTQMVSIYNNNFAGQATGSQNKTGNCALGGTVGITGNTGYDSGTGITNVNLTYALNNCRFTSASGALEVTLTLNGTMTHTGNFKTGYKDEIYSSNNTQVSMVGTASRTGYPDAAIDQSCSYYAQSRTNSVTGTICGRDVSWTF